jgi:hypothetical protein
MDFLILCFITLTVLQPGKFLLLMKSSNSGKRQHSDLKKAMTHSFSVRILLIEKL